MNEKCNVEFHIGNYKDEILCDIMPMDVCHMWKLNPGVRTIALTKIVNQTCKLHTKETEYEQNTNLY